MSKKIQENSKDTRKMERIRRHISTIPEQFATSSNKTLITNDTMQTHELTKTRFARNRQSIDSFQRSLNVQKNPHTLSKEIELGLLYDEYLQITMMDLIMKEKVKEKEHWMTTQLATIAQEIDQDMKNLIKFKTRERDTINLSLAQKETDAQLVMIKDIKNDTFNTMKDMLSKLESLLEPLDIMRCNNIILPETKDEWNKITEILTKCSNTLKNITDIIETKGKIYCSVDDELKNFTGTYNEIENLQKKLEEALCNLQVLILKNSLFSLEFDLNQ